MRRGWRSAAMAGWEAGPAASLVYETGRSYAWALASDAAGNGYVGLGGTAAGSAVVMKVTRGERLQRSLRGKELAVQRFAWPPMEVCWWRLCRMERCIGSCGGGAAARGV